VKRGDTEKDIDPQCAQSSIFSEFSEIGQLPGGSSPSLIQFLVVAMIVSFELDEIWSSFFGHFPLILTPHCN
jgi:hypothetical protein